MDSLANIVPSKEMSNQTLNHFHSSEYYGKCILGGLLSCGLTHTAIVPLDVTKCKMQVFPKTYPSLILGLRYVYRQQGFKGLTLGWTPTLIGYSLQGMFKFGLYESFKDLYTYSLDDQLATKYKEGIWLAASASAETVADIALCPYEMVKVKMQTAPITQELPTFRNTLQVMMRQPKLYQFPFGSLRPLWSRQIPYTMAKFYSFEKIVKLFYENLLTQPKEEYGKMTQLSVTFLSGYLAGVLCALVSHPADSLVSHMGKQEHQQKHVKQLIKEIGYRSLLTRGLGTRVLMIGSLTGVQWWIYDSFKTFMGIGTTGGK
ncbi:uncharacterized protein LOC128884084 [Hylaeus volcanicus]|uniref:uncharacterized protein LOC128884084 n=1 Tax=Hylaeus volcanicus TaxID=313075 RepID=UPI0023B773B7|nr:uncharacterized protein LOC128884084 [Hylaeus volcanicus]